MSGKDDQLRGAAELRERADEIARRKVAQVPDNIETLSPEEVQQTLQELRVFQIELEMQNEELRRTQVELDAARARYFDLYDLAPVGYVTVSEKGLILESNLTAATLLGVPRGALLKQPLSRFILPEDQDIYYLHRKQIFEAGEPQTYSLRMKKMDGTVFWAHLVMAAVQNDEDGTSVFRVVLSDISERMWAEDALKESEEKHRLLVENSHDVIYTMTPDGIFTFVSSSWPHLLGHLVDQVVGKHFELFVHPEDIPRCKEWLQKVFKTGQRQAGIEYRAQHADGTWFWHTSSAVPLRDGTGAVVGFEGIAHDITERKQAEEALRFQAMVLNQIQDHVTVTDLEGRITYVNDAVCRILRRSREELIGQSVEAHGEDPTRGATQREIIEQTLAHGKWKGEVVNFASDGAELIMDCRTQVIRDEMGCTVGMCGIATNITERKRAEEAIHERERLLRTILQTTADGFWLVDNQGRVLDVNQAYCAMTGYTRDEILGLSIQDLNADESTEETAARIQRVIANGSELFETRHLRKDGSVFPVEVSATWMESQGGKFVCFFRDLTERKQSEEAEKREQAINKAIIESIPGAFYILDEKGRYVRWNAYQRDEIIGKPEDEIAGTNAIDTIYPDDRMVVSEGITSVLENGEVETVEARVLLRGGPAFRWLLMTGRRISIDGRPFLIGIGVDITERKQMEESQAFLAKTSGGTVDQPFFKALARYLAQSLDMDFVCIDHLEGDGLTARTVAVWCDGHFEDNVSYALKDTPCGDVVGKTICCFPASVCQFFPHDQVLQDLRAESYVGTTLWSHTGQPIGLIAVIGRNPLANRPMAEATLKLVTVRAAGEMERLDAEEALRKSEEKWRNILVRTPQIGVSLDPEARIVFANTHFLALTGWKAEEILGQNWFNLFIPEEIREEVRTIFHTVMHSRDATYFSTGENEIVTRTGERRNVCWSNVITRDTSGTMVDVTCLGVDLTERNRAGEALRVALIKYKTLFNYFPLGITISDEAGTILESNRIAEKSLGVPIQEQTQREIDSPDWRIIRLDGTTMPPSEYASVRALKEKTTVENLEMGIVKPGEKITWLSVTAVPLPLEGYGVAITYSDITKHKQAEETLRASEVNLQSWFNATLESVFLFTRDGTILTCNETFAARIGRSVTECIGQSIYNLIPADVGARRKVIIENVIHTRQPVEFEDERQGRWMRHSICPVFDSEGSVVRMAVYAQDITERKRAEEHMALMAQMLDDAPASITIHGTNGHFLYANRKTFALHGYKEEEFMAANLYDIDVPESKVLLAERFRRIFETGEVTFEVAHYRKDGSTFPLQVLAKLIQWRGENAVLSIASDITDRKQAEEALRFSEEKYRELVENANSIIIRLDTQGNVTFFNEFAQRFFGYSEEEIVGHNVVGTVVPETDTSGRDLRAMMLDIGIHPERYTINENENMLRDGTRVWISWTNKPLLDSTGQIREILCVGIDATARKRAEDDLRRMAGLLDSVREAQSLYIEQGDPQPVFDALLHTIVKMTGSEFGFLDEVLHDADGTPYKVNLTISNISWDAESEALYEQLRAGGLEFRDLNNLAGLPATLQEPVITGDASNDMRSGGLPPGHPPIHSYMGLPVRAGGKVVGVVGVANRPGGYDEEMAQFLEPYLSACAGIIEAVRLHTREREAVEALHESEQQVRKKLDAVLMPEGDISALSLADIIATETIQALMDDLYRLTGIGIGVVDQSGKVLVAIGWQDICTKFHRAHPETRSFCEESDTMLSEGVEAGTFNLYKCKNNMWDMSTPIFIGGRHVGNIFLGQFFYEDEEPDYEFFHAQARKYGFNEEEYIAALDRVPRWSRGTVECVMNFYSRFAEYISTLSYGNLKLARTLEERRQAEEERAKLQDQLIQAQKMEAVGRLAGGVAHDFNNQLMVIIGYSEMAQQKVKPSDPLHEDLEEIRKAAQRSTDTTRQLLTFARKQTVSPKLLDLNKVVSGLVKMLGRLIGEDIGLSMALGNNIWPVKIDPSQVDQILANLAINARDAISGVGKISIETVNVVLDSTSLIEIPDLVPGDYVRISVSDDGCGMDEETLKHIFEPFYTTKKVGAGTGLGLATVYGIVMQNEGYVSVSSTPGGGTTFHIYLPRFCSETAETKTDQLGDPLRGNNQTILLVEDEESVLMLGKRILENLGYRVVATKRTEVAIQVVQEHAAEIDLLVTDVVMPEMNGKELENRVRMIKPDIKCLFMSGYTADVIARRGVLEEGVPFIQKPFTVESLAGKIHELLDQSK